MEAEKYPLDFDALKKGSSVSTKKLEEILECKSDLAEFGFKTMQFCRNVNKRLLERNIDAAVVMQKKTLKVLTSAEAQDYVAKSAEGAIGKFFRVSRLGMRSVDPSELSAERRQRYESETLSRSILGQAIRKTQCKARKLDKRGELGGPKDKPRIEGEEGGDDPPDTPDTEPS